MANNSSGLINKSTWGVAFILASVWFSTHVGGGFATGNQAVQYYVQYGWIGGILPFLGMLLLAWCMRVAIIMAKTQNIYSYKDLFEYLWQPFPKIELTFEVFYYIIMIAAVGSAIAGAASLFVSLGFAYEMGVLVVGMILLVLTVFGAKLVSRAATVMSVGILIASFTMYFIGIEARAANLGDMLTKLELPGGFWWPVWLALIYASFQAVSVPAVVACSQDMKTKKRINAFFILGFLMNGCALGVSCWMLLGWYPEIVAESAATGKSLMALPNLYVCQKLDITWLYIFYWVALFLAFISTGVSCIFALVVRLENNIFKKATGFFSNIMARRILISVLAMSVSMGVSLVGLTNIVRYGYGLCGYIALAFVIIPLLTIGQYKNRKFLAANPGFWDELDKRKS